MRCLNKVPFLVLLLTMLYIFATPDESSAQSNLTLSRAFELAMERNPDLVKHRFEMDAAGGSLKQARLIPNPTVFGEIEEFGGSNEFSGTDIMSGKIGVSQEIILGGKRKYSIEMARTEIQHAELEYLLALDTVMAEVEAQFYTLHFLQEQLQLRSDQLQVMTTSRDVVVKRVKAGEASPLDLAQARVELSVANIEQKQAKTEWNAARSELAALWNEADLEYPSVTIQTDLEAMLNDGALYDLLKISPAWKLQELELRTAGIELDLAQAERVPDLEIEGGVNHFGESNDHAFFIGVSIPLPLFDRNQGGIQAARIGAESSRLAVEAGLRSLRVELENAWRTHMSTAETQHILESELIPISKDAFEAMSKAYRAGEVDYLSLLEAQRTWIETRQQQLELNLELSLNRIELKRLSGQYSNPRR